MSVIQEANYFEVHDDWIYEFRRRLRMARGDILSFAQAKNLKYLDAFWFFKGTILSEGVFQAICDFLDFDWKKLTAVFNI